MTYLFDSSLADLDYAVHRHALAASRRNAAVSRTQLAVCLLATWIAVGERSTVIEVP